MTAVIRHVLPFTELGFSLRHNSWILFGEDRLFHRETYNIAYYNERCVPFPQGTV